MGLPIFLLTSLWVFWVVFSISSTSLWLSAIMRSELDFWDSVLAHCILFATCHSEGWNVGGAWNSLDIFFRKVLNITQVSSWNVEPEIRSSIIFGCRSKKGWIWSRRVEKTSCPFYLQNDTDMKRNNFLLKVPQEFAKMWRRGFGVGEWRTENLGMETRRKESWSEKGEKKWSSIKVK